MLAFDRQGSGEPLVLLHGTNSDRTIWDPVVSEVLERRDVIAVDLPAHGGSPPSSYTPPGFALDVAELFDSLGLQAPAVVGHSVGGWTALELVKLGRAGAVLALAPAGLWRDHSPVLTNVGLRVNWRLAQLLGGIGPRLMRSAPVRRVGLASISAQPGKVSSDAAAGLARTALASKNFPEHFRQTRILRFENGHEIAAEVPVKVIWGDKDRVALAGKSRFEEELPDHAKVETWENCGHLMMWDRYEETVAVALDLSVRGAFPDTLSGKSPRAP